MTTKRRIVTEYLEKHTDMPARQLARIIYKNNNHLFKDEDDVRGIIRYATGVSGDKNRKKLTDRTFEKRKIVNTFNLPIPEYDNYEPYYMDSKSVLVLSDIHFPYHDLEALNAAIQYGKDKDVDAILLNGDILDMYQLSRFNPEPGHSTTKDEIEMMKTFMQVLNNEFPGKEIVWKIGNHEERLSKFLRNKAVELYDWPEWKLDFLINSETYNYKFITDKRIVYVGDFPIGHGHEWNINNTTIFPARNLYLKAKESCAIGHVHKTSEYIGKTVNGDMHTVYTTGCLCQLYPEYARMNEWNHGFGHVVVGEQTRFINLRIEGGQVYGY